jgi:hypothetical protein
MSIDLANINLNEDMLDQLASGNQDFGPRTPFTDWRNAANELARESEDAVAQRALDLYSEVDPGRGRAMGGSTRDLAYKEIVQKPNAAAWMETYTSQELPPYKVDPVSGEKVYINTPAGVNLIDLLEGKDKQEYLAKKKAGYDERITKTPYNVETGLYGAGAGDYGTRVIPETPSRLQEALSSPVAAILSSFIPGGQALLTAGKVLSGSGRDIGLMEAAGAVAGASRLAGTPTATGVADNIEFTAAAASGNPALAFLNKGTDLVDETGKVVGRTTLGKKFTTDALEKVGLTDDFLSNTYNINQDDLIEGLFKAEKELAKGSSLDDALLMGLGTYVKEGGSLGDLPNLSGFPNLSASFETPELLKQAEDAIRTAGSAVDDVLLQPPKEVAETIYESLEAPNMSTDVGLDVDLPSLDVDLPSLDVGLAAAQPTSTGSVTENLFEDFLFEKKYQAPQLLERTVPLPDYQAPGLFRGFI